MTSIKAINVYCLISLINYDSEIFQTSDKKNCYEKNFKSFNKFDCTLTGYKRKINVPSNWRSSAKLRRIMMQFIKETGKILYFIRIVDVVGIVSEGQHDTVDWSIIKASSGRNEKKS